MVPNLQVLQPPLDEQPEVTLVTQKVGGRSVGGGEGHGSWGKMHGRAWDVNWIPSQQECKRCPGRPSPCRGRHADGMCEVVGGPHLAAVVLRVDLLLSPPLEPWLHLGAAREEQADPGREADEPERCEGGVKCVKLWISSVDF